MTRNLEHIWGERHAIVMRDTSQDRRWLDISEFDFIRSAILVWRRVKQQIFGMVLVYSYTSSSVSIEVEPDVDRAHSTPISAWRFTSGLRKNWKAA